MPDKPLPSKLATMAKTAESLGWRMGRATWADADDLRSIALVFAKDEYAVYIVYLVGLTPTGKESVKFYSAGSRRVPPGRFTTVTEFLDYLADPQGVTDAAIAASA